ncbi:substrate-binding periplasmic protein [Neptunomonas japonica]|uniref:substrate-binding periplasmic protein n=1 Tax=Neptunomonas japonica TaxID=417574 RepID=UPI000427D8D4|nr:transporter substrate-binding domain-containing protein [Neptunomonas japonica]
MKACLGRQLLPHIISIILLFSSPAVFAETLKACGHPFYPPVSWVGNGQLTGLAPAITKKVFNELGYEIQLITDYNWKRCLLEVQLGNADIVVAAFKIPSRKTFLHFTESPLIVDPIELFVNRQAPIKVKQMSDLKGKTVGLLLGDSFGEKFDHFVQNNSDIEYVSRNSQNFTKLALKRIDYVPIGALSGELQSKKLGLHDQIMALDYRISTEFFYLALGKSSSLEKHLPYLNRRLKELTQDGTIEQLTHFYSHQYTHSTDPLTPSALTPNSLIHEISK